MQYKQINDDYFIHIEKNEKVMKTFTEFCMKNNISNAKISGIGAVKNTEVGAYDTLKKEYEAKNLLQSRIRSYDQETNYKRQRKVQNSSDELVTRLTANKQIKKVGQYLYHKDDEKLQKYIGAKLMTCTEREDK